MTITIEIEIDLITEAIAQTDWAVEVTEEEIRKSLQAGFEDYYQEAGVFELKQMLKKDTPFRLLLKLLEQRDLER